MANQQGPAANRTAKIRAGAWAAGLVLGLSAVTAAGCNLFGIGMYALMAEQTKTEKAEVDLRPASVAGKRLVIRVWADSSISWNHDNATLYLAAAIRERMLAVVPDTGKPGPLSGLKISDPRRVEDYLRSRPDGGDSVSPVELARRFKADIVLDVALEEYTTQAPGTDELFQGRIAGSVNLYDFGKGEDSLLPVSKRRVAVSVPDTPIDVRGGQSSELLIWNLTRAKFAEQVVNKFHDREVEMSPHPREQFRRENEGNIF